mgnify:CR=1 FL=1
MYTQPPPLIPHRVFQRFSQRAVLKAHAASVSFMMHPKCQQAWLRRIENADYQKPAFTINVNQNSK